jgi:lipid-binding SYLF domain-containing protein
MRVRLRDVAIYALMFSILFTAAGFTACASWDPQEGTASKGQSPSADIAIQDAINKFVEKDPSIKAFADKAYGYAIFPKISKAAAFLGGAHGHGKVYEKKKLIGIVSLTQATIGFQGGWQSYMQVIFFKDKRRLDAFTFGKMQFSGQISAVLASLGAAGTTDYENGVAVFVLPRGGGMAELSVGGQKFDFEPL